MHVHDPCALRAKSPPLRLPRRRQQQPRQRQQKGKGVLTVLQQEARVQQAREASGRLATLQRMAPRSGKSDHKCYALPVGVFQHCGLGGKMTAVYLASELHSQSPAATNGLCC